MAPRRGKKAAPTVVDEIVESPANDTEQISVKTSGAASKKTKGAKAVKPVEQDDKVEAVPAKAEAKSRTTAAKKNVKQTKSNTDTDGNGESAVPDTVVDAPSKRVASRRIAKQKDATAKVKMVETVETVNGATADGKKASAKGKKKVDSPKVTSKTKSKKAEPKVPQEEEAGPSKPEKKSKKAKPAKEQSESDEDTFDGNVGREYRCMTAPSTWGVKGTKQKGKKAVAATAEPTKSVSVYLERIKTKETVVDDGNVEENNADDSSKGRKRKQPPAKVDADKLSAKKKKEAAVAAAADTVDGGLSSKSNGSPKKRKAAADLTTNDTADELVTKRKKQTKFEAKEAKEQTKTKLNPTSTDLSKIDFEIDKEFSLKIVSWNVAGLRAWFNKGGIDYFEHEKPDIICLQEIKCLEEEVPEEVKLKGYHPYWCFTPGGRGGVAILSKLMPYNVDKHLNDAEMDEEGRIITAEYSKFYLVNVYVPNAGRKLVNLDRRLRWNKLFEKHVNELKAKKPVIICGDMNVAHEEIDLANPKTNRKNAGFSDEERAGMKDLLGHGFIDTFRELYPNQEKAYTFWTYMGNARTKNVGWRLDYAIVSEKLKSKVVDSFMRTPVLGSDHCPIVLLMDI